MKDDQIVRIASGAFATIAYVARLVVHGNGPVGFLWYEPNSFVVVLGVFIILALPETADRFPLGPSKSKK